MRREAAMWKRLRPCLQAARLDPVRVENPIHPGTPDVNLVTGAWLELKSIESFPQRASTIVRIPHFTPQQRVWLLRRWLSGGATYLVLQVVEPDFWYVFDGYVAAKTVGRAPREVLTRVARQSYHRELRGLAEFLNGARRAA